MQNGHKKEFTLVAAVHRSVAFCSVHHLGLQCQPLPFHLLDLPSWLSLTFHLSFLEGHQRMFNYTFIINFQITFLTDNSCLCFLWFLFFSSLLFSSDSALWVPGGTSPPCLPPTPSGNVSFQYIDTLILCTHFHEGPKLKICGGLWSEGGGQQLRRLWQIPGGHWAQYDHPLVCIF